MIDDCRTRHSALCNLRTYSTFSFETMKYLQDGAWGMVGLNIVATVVGCLLACLLGWTTARWLFGT